MEQYRFLRYSDPEQAPKGGIPRLRQGFLSRCQGTRESTSGIVHLSSQIDHQSANVLREGSPPCGKKMDWRCMVRERTHCGTGGGIELPLTLVRAVHLPDPDCVTHWPCGLHVLFRLSARDIARRLRPPMVVRRGISDCPCVLSQSKP